MDKKISTILTIVVTTVSISVVLLGVGFATGLSSYYNSADVYRQAACLDKVLNFVQRGLIRDAGGFHGAIFGCSQIQLPGSIYAYD
jgi:hypothetical protein